MSVKEKIERCLGKVLDTKVTCIETHPRNDGFYVATVVADDGVVRKMLTPFSRRVVDAH